MPGVFIGEDTKTVYKKRKIIFPKISCIHIDYGNHYLSKTERFLGLHDLQFSKVSEAMNMDLQQHTMKYATTRNLMIFLQS